MDPPHQLVDEDLKGAKMMRIAATLVRGRAIAAAAVVAMTFTAPADLWSQARSLSWTETTQLEVPGALGTILRMFGAGEALTTRSAMHLQGRALIQESDDMAFVMDLDEQRWITADHEERTYTSATFEELAELSREVVAGTYSSATADAVADSIRAARADLDEALEEARAEIDFRISGESTGERQRIGGYDATRHVLVAEFEATGTPKGVEEQQGGSIYIIGELWQTDAVEGEDALYAEWAEMVASDPALRDAAEELAADLEESGDALASTLAAWDPAIAAGIREMADAMSEADGTTLRSVLTVAVVPVGVEVDRDALLAWEPASMGDQLRGAAAGAARQAAADAARSAIRGLAGGLFGGGRGQDPEPEPEPAVDEPRVRPLFRITTTREDLSYNPAGGDVLSELMATLSEYQEVPLGGAQ